MTAMAPPKTGVLQRCRRCCGAAGARFRALQAEYPWLEPVRKTLVTVAGAVLIVGGIAIGWLPGPGGFIAFIGIAILASEYRWVRKATRQIEALGHRWHVRVTGNKARWWRRAKRKMSSNLGGE